MQPGFSLLPLQLGMITLSPSFCDCFPMFGPISQEKHTLYHLQYILFFFFVSNCSCVFFVWGFSTWNHTLYTFIKSVYKTNYLKRLKMKWILSISNKFVINKSVFFFCVCLCLSPICKKKTKRYSAYMSCIQDDAALVFWKSLPCVNIQPVAFCCLINQHFTQGLLCTDGG